MNNKITYFPTLEDFKNNEKKDLSIIENKEKDILELCRKLNINKDCIVAPMILKGAIIRTDGFPTETIQEMFLNDLKLAKLETDEEKKKQHYARMSFGASRMDVIPLLYDWFNMNKNTFSYWFPKLEKSYKDSKTTFFKIPKTKYVTLPIELSQFMRIEYQNTDIKSREVFNKILFNYFDLDDEKEYFIKTGVFSSKFVFKNAHIEKGEASEIGEYFQVVNNFAMSLGAGLTNDVVVREYINDVENRPTIYNGMPLRTEFRLFLDFDTQKVYGIVPYWNGLIMKEVLKKQGMFNINIEQDYQTYLQAEDMLLNDFNKYQSTVKKEVEKMLPNLSKNFKGQWSLDIMKNGDDFYLIDMALAEHSAMNDLVNENW